ncbi:MAG: tRNA uridine-5-carboxymethylaminomethyl(34) synthesis GTPase MnmE [Mizugakiibacter sp.]|uniref:tRNA uridine-5-carboxymethylaminomethyl(34) synthesis GTPase MnmE n=1 Tax=Mizugakiibacter sp. TaxID=1972610 RepID=UPI0031BD6877|nr:tRNA uridine-5-carboxymethylaminomethyl(34) synthesis GTPase MnmE [Xanthomonadaceae bacterium]
MSERDTIAAVATPPGAGGVGVLRVSGPQARTIARTLLGRAPRPRRAHLATFRDAAGEALDRGLLLYFPAPHSYTGEHVLELHAHGSPVVLELLLRRVCALGARPARAGEFSERAFLNGKLDLAQAEAVADLIAAGSESAARAALRSLEGEFSLRVRALLDALTRLRVHVEAAIDFPEEEIDFLADPAIAAQLAALREGLAALLAETRRGVRLADGLHVVIVGRPNAGKSSLLNALAASERAIVADIPGTTRDVLRERVQLDGIELTLADTAGLRDSGDVVEREGVRRARAELERADLALLVSDAARAEVDRALLATLPAEAARVVIVNKIDLDGAAPRRETRGRDTWLWLSALSGAGLELLREELKRRAGLGEGAAGAFSARTRHVLALERVAAHLEGAALTLVETRAGELAAEELRQAQHALGEITGEFSSDDLLGAIFASFCIGK